MDSFVLKLAQETTKHDIVFVLLNNIWNNASEQVIQEIQHFFYFKTIYIWKHTSSLQQIQHQFVTNFSFPSIIIVHGLQIFSLQQGIVNALESFLEESRLKQFLKNNSSPSSIPSYSFLKVTVHLQFGSLMEQFFQFLFEDLKETNPYLPILNSQEELSKTFQTILFPLEYIQQEEAYKKLIQQTQSVITLQANEIYQRFEAREKLMYCYELAICCSWFEPNLSIVHQQKQYTLQLSKKKRIVLQQCVEEKNWKCEFWKPIRLPTIGYIQKPHAPFYISTQGVAQLFSLQYQVTEIVESKEWKLEANEHGQWQIQERNGQCFLQLFTRKPISSQREFEILCSKVFPTVATRLHSKL